jgi:adenosine deaminase
MNILVCTVGASWAVVAEAYGFIAPDRLDLYAHHPGRAGLDAARSAHRLQAPDELWLVTSEGRQAEASLDRIERWWRMLRRPEPLRTWTAAGTDQLGTVAECEHVRELILRVVMLAAERTGAGQLVLCLAGGRKTMAADLQTAGHLFGAHALLHVVGAEPMPDALRTPTPELLAAPLRADLAAGLLPMVTGRAARNELVDLAVGGSGAVDSTAFPMPLAAPRLRWSQPASGSSVTAEAAARIAEGTRLLGNFVGHLVRDEGLDNWRSLYRLPAAGIDLLRSTTLDATHRSLLAALPKADLHRHLGGCLDLPAQRQVGRTVWAALTAAERSEAATRTRDLIAATGDWDWSWPQRLRAGNRAAAVAALLVHAGDQTLLRNLYGATEPRLALKRGRHGFEAYERPGELTGSAILCHPAACEPYALAVVEQASSDGIRYVEFRGSPQKYRPEDPIGFLRDLRTAIARADAHGRVDCRFVWILDRRQRAQMASVVAQAVAAMRDLDGFLVGLDLAGDEGTQHPEELAVAFTPAFRECLRLTIHAGEGERAEHVWEAAYHLHADRIGHGLTLLDEPRLADRFRDRGICIELCPTSNREVVGFADPAVPESAGERRYPLRQMLQRRLPVALCTDNPGISRTSSTDEYLVASRMSGGLALWEALSLIRQGFVHAFLPADQRRRIEAEADAAIFDLLARGDMPPTANSRSGQLAAAGTYINDATPHARLAGERT